MLHKLASVRANCVCIQQIIPGATKCFSKKDPFLILIRHRWCHFEIHFQDFYIYIATFYELILFCQLSVHSTRLVIVFRVNGLSKTLSLDVGQYPSFFIGGQPVLTKYFWDRVLRGPPYLWPVFNHFSVLSQAIINIFEHLEYNILRLQNPLKPKGF